MLDTETKRRIDTARDILVGKVPDPKSQVEQITIALIYKFMDDMDADSEELGGKRKFFAGEYTHYGWARLLHAGLGGHEMLNLYAEAITKMPENPGIPPLFRDIFKNAYLPYRDPETLKSFLKIIDGFSYDHSERLGDAFEYLLSVLGSQGDAGQFRTPRHIIDFMVAVVDPKKTDIVLDPACGTAGFLISSWKHILKANTSAKGHSTLTPDDRERLAKNFIGYDISPDMVRLSLVNLYLHGFADPHITEYDSLTSQERWNEYADVILANPPFMSPKGGIKPHNRFSVQSKRSEVLFVDYMAEHLSANGRAGIIVPEGVIFQSQTSYKKLRKMLVEQSLVAVVSLPAGLFQPYSGVKTSILILDKSLAKKSRSIGFFKISNDGFGLGAQRRPIEQNDMPLAQTEIGEYLRRLRAGESLEDFQPTLGLIVDRGKVAANGGYNLSGERYRPATTQSHTFPLVKLGDACTINPRKSQLADAAADTLVSFAPMAVLNEHRMTFHTDEERLLSEVIAGYTYFADNDVLLAKVTPCFENGKAGIARGLTSGIGFGSSEFYVLRPTEHVLPEWIYFCVMHPFFRDAAISQMTGTGGLQRVPRSYLEDFEIPLPPLDIQKEIVAEIEGYQKVIDGARAVLESYRPHIPIHPDWATATIGELCVVERGASPRPIHDFITSDADGVNWVKIGDAEVGGKFITQTRERITPEGAAKSRRVKPGDFILSNSMSFGRPYIMAIEGYIHDGWLLLRDLSKKLDRDFLYNILGSDIVFLQFEKVATGGVVNNLNSQLVRNVQIPLPPLTTQQAIVAEIEAELALVAANRELIARFEKKIATTLARIWGDEDASLSTTAPPTEPTT